MAMVLLMWRIRQHHRKNVRIVILLNDAGLLAPRTLIAQNANVLFTAANSKRKQETVTSSDRAYTRALYILHVTACARVHERLHGLFFSGWRGALAERCTFQGQQCLIVMVHCGNDGRG